MMNISNSRSRRSGFTLIEVAIALAIFVFGALAIIQIFPPALGVVRNNESRVAATQLGETMLARTSGKPSSVPDAIYDGDATGVWQDTPAAVVGTASKNASLPAGMEAVQYNNSALGRFRYVEGERHVVRVNGAGTSKWVLLNHAVAPATTIWVDQEEELSGVQIDEDGKLNFTYATDSQGNSFASANVTRVGQPRDDKSDANGVTYYVSYKWVDGGQINGVIDEPLWLYDRLWTGTDGIVAQGILNTDDRIVPGSVKVRYRQRIGSTVLADPGASSGVYDVSDGQVLDASSNPVNLTAGQTYRFSYSVSDWRWLMNDGNVPTTSGTIQLPIRNLEETPVWSVQTVVGNASAPVLTNPAMAGPNYKNGTVPQATGSGLRYRTVYRALDGWAQQLSVAAKSYIPFYTSRPVSSPSEPWREYYWPGTGNQLYFHPSEAGKSVVVSLTDGAGQRMNGIVLTIDKMEASTVPPTGFFGTGNTTNQVAYATLTDLAGNPVAASSILSVQGLSVQARTAWQNADRYNQVIVPAYRTLLQ